MNFKFKPIVRYLWGVLAVAVSLGSAPKAFADEDVITGVPLHGFASTGWAFDDSKNQNHGYSRGFYLDNVDLYLAPDLGSRVRFLAEIALEPGMEDQAVGIDTERLQLGYVLSNYLTAWVGRFHTPMGAYVIGYHHGAQLQTAVMKPRFLDFEDHFGSMPVHTTGLWLTGNAFMGNHRLGYMAWMGNGDRITTGGNYTSLDMNMVHDDNHDTAFGGRLTFFFGDALDGLQIGVTGIHQKVDSDPSQYNNQTSMGVNLNIYAAHLDYENHGFEFLNELYGFSDSDVSAPDTKFSSVAGFSQLAYWIDGVFAPYVRYERGAFNVNDPYFYQQSNGLPYSKGAFGMRYNLNSYTAVKLELSQTKFNAQNDSYADAKVNEVRSQLAIRF